MADITISGGPPNGLPEATEVLDPVNDRVPADNVSAGATQAWAPGVLVREAGALMRSGVDPMTGDLDLDGNDVVNVAVLAAQDVDVASDITVAGTVDGRDVAVDGAKLDLIEAAADVTDAANVAAAGALMTDGSATMAADLDLDGNDLVTGAGLVDGRDVSVDGAKLDLIEAAADVTDAANVAAAGALMRSGGTMTGALNMGGQALSNFIPSDYQPRAPLVRSTSVAFSIDPDLDEHDVVISYTATGSGVDCTFNATFAGQHGIIVLSGVGGSLDFLEGSGVTILVEKGSTPVSLSPASGECVSVAFYYITTTTVCISGGLVPTA